MEYRLFETILRELHQVPASAEKAFRARLRILRDVGVPPIEKPGKGARVDYKFEDLWLTHLGLAFDDSGFPPLAIKDIAEAIQKAGVLEKFQKLRHREGADLWLRVVSLQDKDTLAWQAFVHIHTLEKLFTFLRALEGTDGSSSFVNCLFNLSQACVDCERGLSKHS